MPRIPSSNSRRVQSQAFNSRGMNVKLAEAPNMSGALQQLGNIASDVFDIEMGKEKHKQALEKARLAEQKKADDVEYNKYSEQLRRIRLEESQKYKQLQKEDALKGFDPSLESYNSRINEVMGSVPNERVKERLGMYSEKLSTDFNYDLNNHSFNEREKYDDEVANSSLNSITSVAVTEYSAFDPATGVSRLETSLKEQKDLIENYADRKGLSKEAKNQMLQEKSSELHYAVVNKMLAEGKDKLAKEYYESIKGRKHAKDVSELSADASTKLAKLIEGGEIRGEAQRVTQQLMDQGLNYQEGISKINEMINADADPELIDETRRRFKMRLDEKKKIEAEQLESNGLAVAEKIHQMGIDKISVEEMQSLEPAQRKELEKMASLISKGYKVRTDPLIYDELKMMASQDATQDKFLKTDLTRFMARLSPGDMDKLRNIKRGIIENKTETIDELAKFSTDTQILKDVAQMRGIKNDKDMASFRMSVMQKANDWMQSNGKDKIPNDVLNDIAQRQAVEVDIKGTIFDKKLFEVNPNEDVILGVEYDSIPSKDKMQIRQLLQKKNRPSSDEDVAKYYLHVMSKTRGY